jgi:hypothetical protein
VRSFGSMCRFVADVFWCDYVAPEQSNETESLLMLVASYKHTELLAYVIPYKHPIAHGTSLKVACLALSTGTKNNEESAKP